MKGKGWPKGKPRGPQSPEHKEKNRQAHIGNITSPITKAKQRANCKKLYGIEHHGFIEDRTQIRPSQGYPQSYYDIQPLIRDRDGHVCQLCGEPEEDRLLDVHHIDKNRLNSDPFNLVSLCRSCHRKVHKGDENER